MADVTTVKYAYPPNFEGTFPPGTPRGCKEYKVHCTNDSDGTGETEVIKIHREDLLTPDGNVPSKLAIMEIEYSVSGLTAVVRYDNENDEEVLRVYDADGKKCFRSVGGFIPEDDDGLGNGNIVISTEDQSPGDGYTISITVRAKD